MNYELGIRDRIPNSKFLILNFLAGILFAAPACGRKGPPLPPLVRVPVAPEEFTATRRGDTVELEFQVPAANTDKTRPANVERVEIYGLTATARVVDADIVERGERVAIVDVKAPRDPDRTIDPDEPASDLQPLQGQGLDQGAVAKLSEDLTPAARDVDASVSPAEPAEEGRPLVGPSCTVPTRTYVGFGISTQGRRGSMSRRVSVPLVAAPAAPPPAAVSYDETGVTINWRAGASAGADPKNPAGEYLDSRPIGCSAPTIGYHVYEIGTDQFETRLTDKPVSESTFVDRRVEWNIERCYTVRAVQAVGGLSVESVPAPPVCEKLVDTFAPAQPTGLVVVASERAINLIWDANIEKDLAGYLVLRAPAETGTLVAVTPEPLRDTTFTDKVEPGTPFIYAIQAVDANGNRSAPSAASTPESAR